MYGGDFIKLKKCSLYTTFYINANRHEWLKKILYIDHKKHFDLNVQC